MAAKSDFTLKMIYDQGKDTHDAFGKFKDDIQKNGCTPGRADRRQLHELRETVKKMPDCIAAKVAASVNGNGGTSDEVKAKAGPFSISVKGKEASKFALLHGHKLIAFIIVLYIFLILHGKLPDYLMPPIIQKIAAMPGPEEE